MKLFSSGKSSSSLSIQASNLSTWCEPKVVRAEEMQKTSLESNVTSIPGLPQATQVTCTPGKPQAENEQ